LSGLRSRPITVSMRRFVQQRAHLLLAGYAVAVFVIDAAWRLS
jgi:hypothetical protein